ncbi:hypothetical protein LCGC14_1887650 [marine sediment metagenome]|uniref:Uncharacterized protein n=1 Tax=marine sediment metagenome TaxID=412755 RepID=A0A0F9GNP2_9ZZZZ
MFVLSVGFAQQVEYTNQVTVKWNAVIPIEPTDIISYQLWTDNDGIVIDGETDLLVYTFTFSAEGEYILGVSTKREAIFPSFSEIVYSDINWSIVDVPVGSTPIPFVVRHIEGIPSPGNLRLQ